MTDSPPSFRTPATLDEAGQAFQDLAPVMRMHDRVVHAARNPEWCRGLPTLTECPPSEVEPLLHGMTLGLETSLARDLFQRLQQAAAEIPGTPPAPVVKALLDKEVVDLVAGGITHHLELIKQLAQSFGLEEAALTVLAGLTGAPLLLAANTTYGHLVSSDWPHGHCPVCGGWPAIAEMRGLDRERWLRCGWCAGAWQYHPHACPFCGEQNHDNLGYLAAEAERESRRATVCEKCRAYVKTFATLSALNYEEILVHDFTSVELDLSAMQSGYARPPQRGFPLNLRVEARGGSRWPRWLKR